MRFAADKLRPAPKAGHWLFPVSAFRFPKRQNAFSVIEFLISVAVIVILAVFLLDGFRAFRESAALNQAADQAETLLRQARQNTLASQGASSWGLNFSTTTLTLFAGGALVAGNASNTALILPSPIQITAINLSTSTGSVVFRRLSGEALATGTIQFSNQRSGQTKTLFILDSGLWRSQ